MKAAIGCAFLCLVFFVATTIAWERNYNLGGNEVAMSIVRAADGGYIVAGNTQDFATRDSDLFALKLNSNGDTLWTRRYGGDGADRATAVASTPDGGSIVVGTTASFGLASEQIWVLKLDSAGDTLWTRTYGGAREERANCVAVIPGGGYIVGGITYSLADNQGEAWILKLDDRGDTIWTRTYDGLHGSPDEALGIAAASDGGYVLAGRTRDVGDIAWILKLGSDGDTLWTRTFRGGGSYAFNSISTALDNGFILAGYNSVGHRGNAWIVKINAAGDTLWTRTIGDARYYGIGLQGITATSDGGFVGAGYTLTLSSTAMDENAWLVKLSASGDTLWTRTYGGDSLDIAWGMAATPGSGCVLAGMTQSFGAVGADAYVLKLNSLGYTSVEPIAPEIVEIGHITAYLRGDNLALQITLSHSAFVKLNLLNLAGETIMPLTDRNLPAGDTRIEVPSSSLAAGVYLVGSNGTLSEARVVVVR